jgi:hypothetical protein
MAKIRINVSNNWLLPHTPNRIEVNVHGEPLEVKVLQKDDGKKFVVLSLIDHDKESKAYATLSIFVRDLDQLSDLHAAISHAIIELELEELREETTV